MINLECRWLFIANFSHFHSFGDAGVDWMMVITWQNLEVMDGSILNQSISLVQWKSYLKSSVTKTIKGCHWMNGLVSGELKWNLSEFGLKSRGEHNLALIEKCEENGANIWKYLDIRCPLSAQQRDILIQGVSLSALRRCPFIRGWFRLECSLCTRKVSAHRRCPPIRGSAEGRDFCTCTLSNYTWI